MRPTARPHQTTRARAKCAGPQPRLLATQCAIAADIHPRHNEDRLLLARELWLAGVFDGVGGSAAGEVAARLAAEAVARDWRLVLARTATCDNGPEPPSAPALDLPRALDVLLQRAHLRVLRARPRRGRQMTRQPGGPQSRSTTAAVVAFAALTGTPPVAYRMAYAWAGDSRVYFLPAHQPLRRLTQDDGVLAGLVREGMLDAPSALRIDQAVSADDLSASEQVYFKMRNGITQALGDRSTPVIHTGQVTCAPGDRILLCSDGIHDNLTDREIEHLLRLATPANAAREIVGAAQHSARLGRGQTLRAKYDDMAAIVLILR